MSFSILATILIAAYVAASVLYVYRWRGYARYPSFSQYLRKSWPVFAPFNCLLYLATRAYARRPVLDAMHVDGMGMVRRHWAQIRDEAVALHAAGELDATTRPVVPNTMEDERGLFSRIFSAIAPWRAIAATVKRKHRTAYVWLKVASNTALVLVAFALVYLVLDSMARTGAAAIH